MLRSSVLFGLSCLLLGSAAAGRGEDPPCEFDPEDPCNILPPQICPEGLYYITAECGPLCCEWCATSPNTVIQCAEIFGGGVACGFPGTGQAPLIHCGCETELPSCWICTDLDSACPANPRVGGILVFKLDLMSTCAQNGPYTWTICEGDVDIIGDSDDPTLTVRVNSAGNVKVRGSVPGPGCGGPFQTVQNVPIPSHCPGDVNGDRVVDNTDLLAVIGAWGNPACGGAACCPADLDLDGDADITDLLTVIGGWGPCP